MTPEPNLTVVEGPDGSRSVADPRAGHGRPRRPTGQPRHGLHHGRARPPRPARSASRRAWRRSTEQVARCYEQFSQRDSDVAKWVFLTQLHDSNEVLFYRLVGEHVAEMLPIVYTPTVGTAIQEFSHLFRRPRGVFLNVEDVDGIDRALDATGPGPGRHRPGRRLRRRGHPRHRRLGSRRDRHLDRQARGLHGRGRHRPAPGAGRRPRRRHEPRVAAQRPALPRAAPLPGPRRGVRRVHRRLRRQRVGALPEGDPALGGLLRSAGAGDPGALRRHPVHLRRRHPGHGRRRSGVRPRRGPRLRWSAGRPADRGLRRGLGRRRDRRPDRARHDRGRAERRRRPPTGSTCSTVRVCSPAT